MYLRALVFILSDIEDSRSSSHYDLPVRKSIRFHLFIKRQLIGEFEVSPLQFSSSAPERRTLTHRD